MGIDSSPVDTDIDFERDGKQSSSLQVPYSRNTSAWGRLLVPITVIKNGTGPTILFTGGNHGDEYEGPVSLLKLARALEPEDVQGRVIIVPALNLPAVRAGRRLSPIDGKDMNRVFPGDPRGTITQVIAHYVQVILLPLCDAVVDLHSGGYSLRFVPYISMHYLEDAGQRERTFAALQAFGAPVGLIIREIGGEGLLDYEVERLGKVFLCAELGGGGALSPAALEIAENGVWNLLSHFDLIEAERQSDPETERTKARLMEVPAPEYYAMAEAKGIYESTFELGDPVEAGQAVGQLHTIEDPTRRPLRIVAQRSGTLIGTRGPGYAERGDTVAVLARDHSQTF